jgi:predicted Zn-ribbon and HTH transcriptional regulator
VNVESELNDAERDAAPASVLERIAHAASGEAEMTTDPAECSACGFRRVRLCAVVE